ncbi:hydroxymethylpyrimidine/phosphomethylpyrimidine kinase [Fibrobacterales bacterium]|nr:hydroxymethylpyrimidine/phosphomethylpyrimidine kinase [Fibrobacterales bacterium]
MLSRNVNNPPQVITIAGFDPSAGAGILADIKAFEHCKIYGKAVCTALTIQNENKFLKPNWLSWEQIKEQLEILGEKYGMHNMDERVTPNNKTTYIKIGLMENPLILEKIFKYLQKKYPSVFIIWDPILKASTNFEFHRENAVSWRKIMSYANLITPNLPEAEFLGIEKGHPKVAVLVKGGHLKIKSGHSPSADENSKSTDILYLPNGEIVKFSSKRINAERHGSGCTLSALILANLAQGKSLVNSCKSAKHKVLRLFNCNFGGKLGVLWR